MKNEMNHRTPRRFGSSGMIEAIPLGASTGKHSADPKQRKSEIEDQVGLAVSLYFKFLKYMGRLLLCFFALSILPMMFYISGDAYDSEQH